MMKRLAPCLLAFVALGFAGATPASAHAQRDQQGFHFEIGWGTEPTYAGISNSVQLIVTQAGKPVTDLGDTMKVEVRTGTQKLDLPVEADFQIGEFGEPGDYRAWIIPTAPGDYTFVFHGTIHGRRINISITSGETTFDMVKDPAEIQFPVKQPAPADVEVLAANQNGRLAKTVAAVRSSASNAKTMGLVGIVVGALGLIVAAVAVTRKRA